jgi:hypothetical protein
MSDDPLFTESDAKQKSISDYEAVLGTVIRPEWIIAYKDDTSHDIRTHGKVASRVKATAESDLTRVCDTHIDPYWDLEIVEDPENLLSGYTSPWTWGKSYRIQ